MSIVNNLKTVNMIFIHSYLKLIGVLILVSLTNLVYSQGWVKHYESIDSNHHLYDIEPTQDGGYFIVGVTRERDPMFAGGTISYPLIIRVDSDGDVIWKKYYTTLPGRSIEGVEEIPNGGAICLLQGGSQDASGYVSSQAFSVSPTGVMGWMQTYPATLSGGGLSAPFFLEGHQLQSTNDGNVVLMDNYNNVFKITPQGTPLWKTETYPLFSAPFTLSMLGESIVEIGNNNFVFVGGQKNPYPYDLTVQIVNDTGVLAKVTLDSTDMKGIAIVRTSDQALLFVGNGDTTTNDSLTLIKTDDNLNPIWRKKHFLNTPLLYGNFSPAIDIWEIKEAGNGDIWCLAGDGNANNNSGPSFLWIYIFDSNGNYIKTVPISTTVNSAPFEYFTYAQFSGLGLGNPRPKLLNSIDGGFVVGLTLYTYDPVSFTSLGEGIALVKLDSLGNIYSTLEGTVYGDYNLDCTHNVGDVPLSQEIVTATRLSDGRSFYGVSDTNGYYNTPIDTGIYTIQIGSYDTYWQVCAPGQSITFNGQARDSLDIGMEPLVNCPLLQVDLSAPLLRNTGNGSAYSVSVCNFGTVNAQSALVEVDFDAQLNIGATSIPIVSQIGTRYSFNLGAIPIGDCINFTVQVIADSTVLMNQTLCSEAYVYPDSICLPNYWSGAVVDVTGKCLNDTVFFEISNIGSNMGSTLEYYVFEDHVMMRQGTFQLNNGATKTIAQAALPGRTYRLSTEQEIGFPPVLGNLLATAVVEACVLGPNSSFNSGFVNQFSNGHSNPFVAIDCQPLRAAYDPNDKSAQPEGYQSQHYIDTTTAIDYKIRFQNTGTDTAFYVMIKDTLSPYLDPSSIQMGASSHPYTWRLLDNGVLKVAFSNIKLVDSITNEPLSHGFFRYRIQQKPNNSVGTVINNSAAIYFDYNPPIITNTTFHTIGENFITILLSTEKIYQNGIEVKVYPNPFKDFTTLEVQGKDYETLTLNVYDLSGRVIQTLKGENTSSMKIYRQDLPQGAYIYQLEGNGQRISTGKIIVQGN